jgi:hypothetical protein
MERYTLPKFINTLDLCEIITAVSPIGGAITNGFHIILISPGLIILTIVDISNIGIHMLINWILSLASAIFKRLKIKFNAAA